MILAPTDVPLLWTVVLRAAEPDEDVFRSEIDVLDGLERGFPRLVIVGGPSDGHPLGRDMETLAGGSVPVLRVEERHMEAWEATRREHEIPPSRLRHHAVLLREEMAGQARRAPWVNQVLRDVQRASPTPLPPALKALGRRVLEFPARYTSLSALARSAGHSSDSLRGHFRRRGLESPFTYMRWFRVLAVGQILTTLGYEYRAGSFRLGFSSSANMCRFVETVSGLTTGEVTASGGTSRLVATLASELLTPTALEGWTELDTLFHRDVA